MTPCRPRRACAGLIVLVTTFWAGTDPAAGARQQTPAAAPHLDTVSVNGVVLNYLDSGPAAAENAPPIVFVHGTLGYYAEWRNQFAAFSKSRRVITYSRRYHRPNAQIDDGQAYTPELHAADLAALIGALHLGRIDLVGSSYGAAIALELARRHPALIHSIVLAEPAVNLYTTKAEEQAIRERAGSSLQAIDQTRALFARGDDAAALRTFFDGTAGPGAFDAAPAATRDYLQSQVFELRKEMTIPADTWLPRHTCADFRRVNVPVLLLTGERTPPIYHDMLVHLAACLPGARIATIPRVGHRLVDNSPAFNAEVARFLGNR